jgi:peptidoglycan hydrolase-like protein with peptidoglycan-binding domain
MGKAQIQKGSQGDYVKEWQDYLIGKGYDLGKGGADGIFGSMTDAATRKYQQDMGLSVDGIVGEKTWGTIGGTGSSGGNGSTGYQYKTSPFTTSEETNNAYAALGGLAKPEGLDPSYEAALKEAMDKINNREKFSYDLNGDALYQQYKDKYIQQGKMAMQDTMGQAAALTGGYGNSYAATAGNQAYQAHLNNLNDIIPELQQMAYDRYRQEGQDLLNQYSMAKDVYGMKYGEYADQMSQYNSDRQYLQSVYESLYGKDWDSYRANISDEQWAAAMDYQAGRDKVEDSHWDMLFEAQHGSTGGGSGSGGSGNSGGGSGSSGGSGGNGGGSSYDNGKYSDADVKQAQAFVGASADGKWGAKSAAAAKDKGYNSLAEVITAMTKKYEESVGWSEFDNDNHRKNVVENGGSYYSTALADLKRFKAAGKSNSDAMAYLSDMVGNSLLSRSEYLSLYNKYRDNKLG